MKTLSHQIIKFNNKDSIMEVMANAFEIGKVQVHMHKYDQTKEKGNKITQSVDIFVNIPTMMALCADILSGNISAKIKKLKDAGKKYESAWIDQGGISARSLKERQSKALKSGKTLSELKYTQKERSDGKSLSRVFKIVPSIKDNMAFTFQSESGVGEENEQGLIVSKFGTKPENRVMMAVSAQQAKEFALMIQTHLQAFIAQKYVRMEDEKYYSEYEQKSK